MFVIDSKLTQGRHKEKREAVERQRDRDQDAVIYGGYLDVLDPLEEDNKGKEFTIVNESKGPTSYRYLICSRHYICVIITQVQQQYETAVVPDQ